MKTLSSYLNSKEQESFTIQEAGLKLSPEDYLKVRMRLKSLEAKVPATSVINFKVTKIDSEKFKGELVIFAPEKTFKVVEYSDCAMSIFFIAHKQIKKNILGWKKSILDKYINFPIFNSHKINYGGYVYE